VGESGDDEAVGFARWLGFARRARLATTREEGEMGERRWARELGIFPLCSIAQEDKARRWCLDGMSGRRARAHVSASGVARER
jgi:hypothetical protein